MPEVSELLGKLGSDRDALLSFLADLREADWQREVYADGATWTIRNVIAHIVAAERAFADRLFPNVLAGGGGVSEDFSIDRYNARQQEKLQDLSPDALPTAFMTARTALMEWVAKLTDLDLDAAGRHPFLGQTTLREMVKMVFLHSQLHRRDIKRALK